MKTFSSIALILIASAAFLTVPVYAQNDDAPSSRKVISKVSPSYPALARSINLTGSVKLEAVVAPNGSVKSIQVVGGNPVLAQSAEVAVRGWKWEKSDHETTERVEVNFNP